MFTLKTKIIGPVEIAGLSVQQQLVLQQQYTALAMLKESNAALDGKASTYLTAGGLLVTLATALGIPGVLVDKLSPYILTVLAVAVIAFLRMLWASARSASPTGQAIPGSSQWEDVFKHYFPSDQNEAYNAVLANLLNNRKQLIEVNENKSRLVRIAAWSLLIQLAALTLAAVLINLL